MVDGPEWRVIDAEDSQSSAAPADSVEERVPRWLIAAIVAVVGLACALAIWMTLPTGGAAVEATSGAFDPRGITAASAPPSAEPGGTGVLVIDVQGAVAQPGLHELRDGSRVGDAIAAAGGYSADVDIAAASRLLNLAAKVADGDQVRVPTLGDLLAASLPATAGASEAPVSNGGGLVDLNHASADELDTLPGIGPVTAQKIIDARTEAPFASIDELQSRGVVGPSTFEKLRDLITVTP